MIKPVVKRIYVASAPNSVFHRLRELSMGKHGMMENWLHNIKHKKVQHIVYGAFHPDTMKIIGWGCLYYHGCIDGADDSFPYIGVFVDSAWRANGIGKILVEKLMEHECNFYYDWQSQMSQGFYGQFDLPSSLRVTNLYDIL